MSLELRARAALAGLELFGFNPHQRRGPDGKFIKMADHELKRPRRPRKPKATPGKGDKVYRQRREAYNDGLIRDAREQREGFGDPTKYPELERLEKMKPGPARDLVADELAEKLNERIPDPNDRYQPPTAGGPQMVEDPRVAWRAARDAYNESVLDYAEAQVEPLAKQGHDSASLADKIENIRFLKGDPEYDIEIDELRDTLTHYYGHDVKLPRPPAPPGMQMVENPLYRARREEYNEDVMGHVASNKVIMQDEDKYPELYGLHAQAEGMAQGSERDAVIDSMVELLNQHKTVDSPYRPPTTGGPQYAQQVGGGQRPGFDAPYSERVAALRRSVDTGAYDEQIMAQGAMGETRRFDLADGTSAVYKRQTRDWDRGWEYPLLTKETQADAEELAAVVANALGVKAPAVARTSDTEFYMEMMPGKIGELAWVGRAGAPKRVVDSPQGLRMGLLDTLIENTDRHGGNYLADEDENLYAIDHGLAFSKTDQKLPDGTVQRRPVDRVLATGEFALANFVSPSGNLYDNPLSRADGEKLKRVVADLRQQFVDAGRLNWWESMNERAQHIAARATGTEDVL